MESRLALWVDFMKRMRGLPDGPEDDDGIMVLGALTVEEADALDNKGLLPSYDRIEAIATQAGITPERAIGLMRGYLHGFSERIGFIEDRSRSGGKMNEDESR